MLRCLVQPGELERPVARRPRGVVNRGGGGVAAGEVLRDGGAPGRVRHADEAPGPAVAHRGRPMGRGQAGAQMIRIDRVRPEAAHVAAPREQRVERLDEGVVEGGRTHDAARHTCIPPSTGDGKTAIRSGGRENHKKGRPEGRPEVIGSRNLGVPNPGIPTGDRRLGSWVTVAGRAKPGEVQRLLCRRNAARKRHKSGGTVFFAAGLCLTRHGDLPRPPLRGAAAGAIIRQSMSATE